MSWVAGDDSNEGTMNSETAACLWIELACVYAVSYAVVYEVKKWSSKRCGGAWVSGWGEGGGRGLYLRPRGLK